MTDTMYDPVGQTPPTVIISGDSFRRVYKMYGDERSNLDLTGWDFSAAWRANHSEQYFPIVVVPVNLAEGEIEVRISSLLTESMSGNGVFDVQGISGEENKTFFRSPTVLKRGITRG